MFSDFFEDDNYYTGPPLTEVLVAHAERELDVKLPSEYLELLRHQNGGVPKRRCFRTPFSTSWAPDHFEITSILGIGGRLSIDSRTGQGSRDMIKEWDYPDIGVVLCDMPSGGHDTVMLDYSQSGPAGEPRVVYIDEDRIPREVAGSFAEFVSRLAPCPGHA